MRYWGKVIGFWLGLIIGKGGFAALLGLVFGHFFDRFWGKKQNAFHARQQQARNNLFFQTSFQIMGHLSKSKGHITETDIQVATRIMDDLGLTGAARSAAQLAYRQGKDNDFPLRQKLHELRSLCIGQSDLLRLFLEFQLQAALADGELHPNEQEILYIIGEEFGIERAQFDLFLRRELGGRHFDSGSHRYSSSTSYMSGKPTIQAAYDVLGVNQRDSPAIIKRVYRKLMNEHHPDKLIAKGLPPEMMELATRKTQEIQAAYDLIKKELDFK